MPEIPWEVEDGYVGHGRHSAWVDPDDIANCEDIDALEELLTDAIQDDFEDTVSWVSDYLVPDKLEQLLEEAKSGVEMEDDD